MYGLTPVGTRPYGITYSYSNQTISPPTLPRRLKYYNGSAWVVKPIKYFNGTDWVEKEIKAVY